MTTDVDEGKERLEAAAGSVAAKLQSFQDSLTADEHLVLGSAVSAITAARQERSTPMENTEASTATANAESTVLDLRDQAGEHHLLPQATLKQGRVSTEHTAEVERLLGRPRSHFRRNAMNEHSVQISRDDVESVVTKFQAFTDSLSPGEQTVLRTILTSPAAESTTSEDVQGHGFGIIIWPGVLDIHVSISREDGAEDAQVHVRRNQIRDHRR